MMVTDNELTTLVKQAILKNERLSLQPIEVSVDSGIVTLTGSVQTYRRKLVAYEVVSSFDDCRDLVNELTVRPSMPAPDEIVAQNVRAALDSHADITKETIVVTVTAGAASLNGNVGSQWERMVAEDVARAARGVQDVNNRLVVSLPDRMEDKQLEQDIREALSHARGLKENRINVAVSGGGIVLSGEVPSFPQKEMAERVTRQFRLWEVRNQIVVTGQ
jgi:osmotically-inducible protein OsmY